MSYRARGMGIRVENTKGGVASLSMEVRSLALIFYRAAWNANAV